MSVIKRITNFLFPGVQFVRPTPRMVVAPLIFSVSATGAIVMLEFAGGRAGDLSVNLGIVAAGIFFGGLVAEMNIGPISNPRAFFTLLLLIAPFAIGLNALITTFL